MLIKIGDEVAVSPRPCGSNMRYGKITDISIATKTGDPAGELGTHISEYDTELDYPGSIGYQSENGDNYWAYFSQIMGD